MPGLGNLYAWNVVSPGLGVTAKLTSDGRTQYDTARRFIAQADDALTKKNLVLARSLADKALAVAAQLAAR